MSESKIGRYQIEGELGKGAMGVVYKAIDPNIGRPIALKTMRVDVHGLERDELVRRFQNEARAAGVLSHPNIVTIYDAGEDNGIFYIAMEYIEGQTLSHVLHQKRSLMASEVVDIGAQICAGLQYAHSKKVVHRDIKPANIMIGPTGSVKIMDFGIAKAGAGLTHTGEVVGTPNYMSPEQVKGRDLDGRSDLFSTGVILYEMLTGERPFTGQSVTTIIYKIVHENPIPPRELDVSIHPGLSMIVTKTLSKDPDDRYQEAVDLATALKSYRIISVPDAPPFAAAYVPTPPPTGALKPPTVRTAAMAAAKAAPAPHPATGLHHGATAHDAPTFIGALAPDPPKAKASRSWMLVSLLAILLAVGIGVARTIKHRSEPPPPSATAAEPPQNQSPAVSAPNPPAGPQPDSSEVPDAAPEIAAPAGKSALDAAPQAKNISPPEAPAPVEVGSLRITSTPPGARVTIDGSSQDYYVTPFNAPQLKAGTHSLTASLQGFPPQARQVEVVARKKTTIDFQLTGDNALYNIVSSPAGAEILVDGTPTGTRTPAQLPLKAGKHTIAFRLDGFAPAEVASDSKPGETVSLSPTLTVRNSIDISSPPPTDAPSLGALARMKRFMTGGNDIPVGKGAIQVRTRPKGATITVDGIDARRTTPFKFPMHPGTYNVVVSKAGFQSVTRTVKVEAGKVADVEAVLAPEAK
jgi:serine/threonine-protein kinase